jgi:hypothetical protein
MEEKSFVTLAPGANVIERFTNFRNKLVFVTGKPFQTSLLFAEPTLEWRI